MSFTEIHTKDPAGVIATFEGVVTGQEIISHLEQVKRHKDYVFRLGDMRAATKVTVSVSDLHRIAILECSVPEDHKLEKLALVGEKAKNRWLIDTYFLFVELWVGKQRNYETRHFENLEDAHQWLGTVHLLSKDFDPG